MKRYVPVVVETPFAGKGETKQERRRDAALKLLYLRACMRDCLLRGEAPFASHGLYTQPGVLRDEVPEERTAGIEAGFVFRTVVAKTVVYTDLDVSFGMKQGISHADELRLAALQSTTVAPFYGDGTLEYRTLGPGWEEAALARLGRRGCVSRDIELEVEDFLDGIEDRKPATDDGECHELHLRAGLSRGARVGEDVFDVGVEERRSKVL